jgi:hypothetical protein
MRTIKTYSDRAPFYNAFTRTCVQHFPRGMRPIEVPPIGPYCVRAPEKRLSHGPERHGLFRSDWSPGLMNLTATDVGAVPARSSCETLSHSRWTISSRARQRWPYCIRARKKAVHSRIKPRSVNQSVGLIMARMSQDIPPPATPPCSLEAARITP